MSKTLDLAFSGGYREGAVQMIRAYIRTSERTICASSLLHDRSAEHGLNAIQGVRPCDGAGRGKQSNRSQGRDIPEWVVLVCGAIAANGDVGVVDTDGAEAVAPNFLRCGDEPHVGLNQGA